MDQCCSAGATPPEAGCGSRKWVDEPALEEQVLYESSKKPHISERELQEIFAKLNKGADPEKKLSEEDAGALRRLIAAWKVRGEVLILPFEQFQERMFMSDAETRKMFEELEAAEEAKDQAKALKKLKITQEKQTSEPYSEEDADSESDEEPQQCKVCMKVVKHRSFQCPYLDDIPDPDNTKVGEGYEIRCHHCNKSVHGHLAGTWPGFAWNKSNDCWAESSDLNLVKKVTILNQVKKTYNQVESLNFVKLLARAKKYVATASSNSAADAWNNSRDCSEEILCSD